MLLSYNADLLPRVRMLGRINYTEPWIHFSRTIDEYVLYVIRDGNMYLQEDGIFYHLKTGDFFLLEPGLCHEGYQRAACNYYYAHFTHPEMARMKDEDAAMALLAEKRRLSLVSYNLTKPTPPTPSPIFRSSFTCRAVSSIRYSAPRWTATTPGRNITSAAPPRCCIRSFWK